MSRKHEQGRRIAVVRAVRQPLRSLGRYLGKCFLVASALIGSLALTLMLVHLFKVPRPGDAALIRELKAFHRGAETELSLAGLRARSGGSWTMLCVINGYVPSPPPRGAYALGYLLEAQDINLLSNEAKLLGLWGPLPTVGPYVPLEAPFLPSPRPGKETGCASVEEGQLTKENGQVFLDN